MLCLDAELSHLICFDRLAEKLLSREIAKQKKPKLNKSRDQLVESDALVKQRRANQAHSLRFFYIKQRRVHGGGLRRRGSTHPALMHEQTQKWWDYAKL